MTTCSVGDQPFSCSRPMRSAMLPFGLRLISPTTDRNGVHSLVSTLLPNMNPPWLGRRSLLGAPGGAFCRPVFDLLPSPERTTGDHHGIGRLVAQVLEAREAEAGQLRCLGLGDQLGGVDHRGHPRPSSTLIAR